MINLDLIKTEKEHRIPFVAHEIGNGVIHLQDLYKLCNKAVCLVVNT
jgi:lichenan operon transcriptional antiterminator